MIRPHLRVLRSSDELIAEFKDIGVDRGGWPIMRDKGHIYSIRLRQLSVFSANILKQEMLSFGGDAALHRGALNGSVKATDCLLLGHAGHYALLAAKLKKQPFGLASLGSAVLEAIDHIVCGPGFWEIRAGRLSLARKTLVMGILNATPDSFSGDGLCGVRADRVAELARHMERHGADLLDVGGESTRPGSASISARAERQRIVPVFKAIKGKIRVPLSIDTTKSDVAHAALDLGAAIVNDISALRFDKKMAKLVARYKAGLVLMHMQGVPRTMQKAPRYRGDAVSQIVDFLAEAVGRALDAGIAKEKIAVDPGIGFGKTLGHNLDILRRLEEFKSLGRPILIGVSRKRFIGALLNALPQERLLGTAACVALAVANGANIVRVHDVKEIKQVVKICDAVSRGGAR